MNMCIDDDSPRIGGGGGQQYNNNMSWTDVRTDWIGVKYKASYGANKMLIKILTRALCMVNRSTPVPVILIIGTSDMKLNDTDT